MATTLSPLQMATWATNQQLGIGRHTHHSLTEAAKLLQAGARKVLGYYQTGNAQFPTWPELEEATKEQRVRLGFSADAPLERTHELEQHILYEVEITDLSSGEAVVGVPSVMVGDGSKQNPHRDIGEVALVQEMGTHTIPTRSFLGLTAARLAPEIAQAIGAAFVAELVGNPQQAGVANLVFETIRP